MATDWYRAALARDAGHDHGDRDDHLGASTPNFELLGHNGLPTAAYSGRPAGAYACGDSAENAAGRRLTVVSVFQDARIAFVLADVTDAANPLKVGEFTMRGVGNYDAAITRDARFAVVGFTSAARTPGAAVAGDAAERPSLSFTGCSGEEVALAIPESLVVTAGIILVDLSTPSQPRFADYDPVPGFNLHSVSSAADGADHYVIASVVNLAHPASHFAFDRVVDTPLGARLVRIAMVASPPVSVSLAAQAVVVPAWNGHVDATMQRHPIDGHLYAYLSDWDGGMLTVDMTVPAAPLVVSTWVPPAGTAKVQARSISSDCWDYAIHEVLPIEGTWDGRHYVLAGQECPYKRTTGTRGGSVYVIDNTNPVTPTLVSEWHLPEDTAPWTMTYQASPHYIALHNRTLFASAYHAGLWAIDLANPAQPAAIGVYLPVNVPAGAPAHAPDGTPMSLQVDVFPDGVIVLNDESSGVYTLRFDATNPAPRALPHPLR